MLRDSSVLVGVHDAVVVLVDHGEQAGVVAGGFLEEQFFRHVELGFQRDFPVEYFDEDGSELEVRVVVGLGLAQAFGPEVEAV